MSRTSVLLVFGGESSEHDVSIMGARNVYAAINTAKYEITLTYIDRKGKWWLLDGWRDDLNNHNGLAVALLPGSGSIVVLPENKELHIGVVFPIMHGENGHEDGAIQGMMQFVHAPVVGCGIGASAVCWDKVVTKELLASNGIAVTPYEVCRKEQATPSYEAVAARLGDELFVKPASAGSSIGVSKVRSAEELEAAIERAFEHGETVLIEKAIVGRELEVAVLGTAPSHRTSGVGEVIPGEEFYSYEDKYADDSKARVITRADVPDELREKLQLIAHEAFSVLGCKGLARVDFLVSENGDIYVNEVNTMPGFTNISQYPKLWHESGIGYGQLIDELIADALL